MEIVECRYNAIYLAPRAFEMSNRIVSIISSLRIVQTYLHLHLRLSHHSRNSQRRIYVDICRKIATVSERQVHNKINTRQRSWSICQRAVGRVTIPLVVQFSCLLTSLTPLNSIQFEAMDRDAILSVVFYHYMQISSQWSFLQSMK